MHDRALRCSRRKFLASAAALTLTGGVSASAPPPDATPPVNFRARPPKPSTEGRKPIATVCTVYRPLSHAYHIAGRFIGGYPLDGQFHVPRQHVRSLFCEQVPENDLSREVAREHGVRVTRSIADALTDASGKL